MTDRSAEISIGSILTPEIVADFGNVVLSSDDYVDSAAGGRSDNLVVPVHKGILALTELAAAACSWAAQFDGSEALSSPWISSTA
jgi:hypothetical protein